MDKIIEKRDDVWVEHAQGYIVKVVFYVKYPDYEFFFGVPVPENPMFEKEVGFVQFKDSRAEKMHMGMYVDLEECEEMIKGFKMIREASKKNSPHLWETSKNSLISWLKKTSSKIK